MLRYFLYVLIIAIITYTLIPIFWPIQRNQTEKTSSSNSQDFQELVTQALERNTQLYSVSFYAEEFSQRNTVIWNIQSSLKNTPASPLNTHVSQPGEDENAAARWNFGSPKIWDTWWKSDCSGWLIYDPCLVVWDPIRASGDLRFWS